MAVKQVIVVRRDLQMSPGKMAAQACHASVGAVMASKLNTITNRRLMDQWRQDGHTKVVLGVACERDLWDIYKAIPTNVPYFLVCDAGRTELPESTITCLGIGPADAQEIDRITGHLKLY